MTRLTAFPCRRERFAAEGKNVTEWFRWQIF